MNVEFTKQRDSQELDELVAEHVMGWTLSYRDSQYSYWKENPEQDYWDWRIYYGDSEPTDFDMQKDFQPSRFDGWQWYIFEEFRGWEFNIGGFPGWWGAEFAYREKKEDHEVLHRFQANSQYRLVAFCVAALKAKGHNPDE